MPIQVVLALDGSEKDERALAVAAAIVELTGAPLQLVRVGDAAESRPLMVVMATRARAGAQACSTSFSASALVW